MKNTFRYVFMIWVTAAVAAPVIHFVWERLIDREKYDRLLADHHPFIGFEFTLWLITICAICSLPGWILLGLAVNWINSFKIRGISKKLILTPLAISFVFIPIRWLGSSNDIPPLIFIYLAIIVAGVWIYKLKPISTQPYPFDQIS